MQVRYEGPFPHTTGFNGQPSDLYYGTYHGTFQDFYFGTRFKAVESPRFALTPFGEFIVPVTNTRASRSLPSVAISAVWSLARQSVGSLITCYPASTFRLAFCTHSSRRPWIFDRIGPESTVRSDTS